MATLRQVQPVLMSRDVEWSIRFYAKLGFCVSQVAMERTAKVGA